LRAVDGVGGEARALLGVRSLAALPILPPHMYPKGRPCLLCIRHDVNL
jgi:hypothetical protein